MNANSPFMQMVPFILMIVIFYFLLIRPQQKQMKERKQMLDSLKAGDKIITGAGMIGTIISLNADKIEVEISKNVKVNFLKNSVAGLLKE
ncbi:MAG: preprotein translocase subunit YajC [Elusimicrobia bacterium]|nr:preprotein translocase subunit YajC [Elusimicrobiota bacterium]